MVICKRQKHWDLQAISTSLALSFYIIPTAGRTVVFASRATCILPTLMCAMREVTPTWTKTTCQTSEQSSKNQNFTCIQLNQRMFWVDFYNNNCPIVVSFEIMYAFFQNREGQVSLTVGKTRSWRDNSCGTGKSDSSPGKYYIHQAGLSAHAFCHVCFLVPPAV